MRRALAHKTTRRDSGLVQGSGNDLQIAAGCPLKKGGCGSQEFCTDHPFWRPLAITSTKALPRRLPRHGKRLPDCRPTHLALAEDVHDVLHTGIDALECAVVSSEGFQQRLGCRIVRATNPAPSALKLPLPLLLQ
jgi:hypothetical protein